MVDQHIYISIYFFDEAGINEKWQLTKLVYLTVDRLNLGNYLYFTFEGSYYYFHYIPGRECELSSRLLCLVV